jgi:hypothetical protein
MWRRLFLVLTLLLVLSVSIGLVLHTLAVLGMIVLRPFDGERLSAFLAFLFLLAARFMTTTQRRHYEVHDLGRDLTWDGAALTGGLYAAFLASSIDFALFPNSPKITCRLALGVIVLLYGMLLLLCEGTVEHIEKRRERRLALALSVGWPTEKAERFMPFALSVVSYALAFVLFLCHFKTPGE